MLPARRISLECPVIRGADALKRSAETTLVGERVRFHEPSDYHLTFLHVGRPSEIFAVVTSARSQATRHTLSEERFLIELKKWLTRAEKAMRHDIRVEASRLVSLGPTPPYAVACEVPVLPGEVADLHEALLQDFAMLLQEAFGVPDGTALLQSSEAFGYSGKSWIPHVTVGGSSQPLIRTLPRTIFVLGPLRMRNSASLNFA
jgi:hypothetical protein